MTPNVVDITDLHVSFATDAGTVRAVEGVTLQVAAGEVLAIVGESGSGKTVTARSILGLLPETALTSGAVLLTRKDGSATHDIVTLSGNDLRDVRGRDAAMVFQEPSTALNPVFPVGWQIAEGLQGPRQAVRQGRPRHARSRSCAWSASPTRSTASTTTRTSSRAGRSSASSSRRRSSSTRA